VADQAVDGSVQAIFLWGHMNRFITTFILLIATTACRTTQNSTPASESTSILTQSELHCKTRLSTEGNKTITAEIRFPSSNDHLAMIYIKRPDTSVAQVISSTVSPENMIYFEPNSQEKLAVKLGDHPRISRYFGSFHENGSSPCIQLITNSKTTTAKPASCNAAGTPAQGWYQSGKILQLSSSCNNEHLYCGIAPNPGWYVQKKHQRILAKGERCGFQRERPICKSENSITGWHLGDRLLARDDECSYKQMECSEVGSKKEGWYVYERSMPSLLIASECQNSNLEISYLSH
jgi:hypothetical protein